MKMMMKLLRDYKDNDSGATAMEYGLIVALISVTLIAAFSLIAANSDSLWNTVINDFEAA